MKNEKNSNLIIILIVIIMVVAIAGLLVWGLNDNENNNLDTQLPIAEESALTGNKYVDESVNGIRLNTINKLKETKLMDGIEIKITQVSSLYNNTTILGTIKNTTNEQIVETDILLTVYDDKGNELAKENIGKVIPTLAANQELELNVSIMKDYANAYDMKFERIVD